VYKEFVRKYRYVIDTLKFQELKSRLLFVAMTLRQSDAELGESRKMQAFQVAAHPARPQIRGNSRAKRGSQHAQQNGACHTCGKDRHWKKECPQQKNADSYNRPGNGSGPSVAFIAIQRGQFRLSQLIASKYLPIACSYGVRLSLKRFWMQMR
jgi:hypothetical protein